MNSYSRRDFLKIAGLGISAMTLPGMRLKAAEEKRKPNIIFILIDDMGQRDVGCYGSKIHETPNIDKLASQGMLFTDGYAACPVCSPTRASIMTGKYPARLHLTDWIAGHVKPKAKLKIPDWTKYLPLEEITIADALKKAGYVTASIGKWHLGEGYEPEKQGFDVNVAGDNHGHPPSYFVPYKLNLKDGPHGEYLTDRLGDEALKFLENNKDKPFFLYFPNYAVHTPLQAKKDLTEKYLGKNLPAKGQNGATYAAMVQSVDENVGKIMRKLDELGIADNTIVFFMSDNGGLETVTSNAPLRAGKGTLYEGGVREPWIVKWPEVVKPGSRCSVPVISTDFFSTIMEMAGVSGEAAKTPDGLSIVPLLKQNGEISRDALYWHYPHYHLTNPSGAIRCGDFKLIEYYEDGKLELYDLKNDLSETTDLAAKMPEKAAELRRKLDDWRKSVGAQMPTPNPDYDPTASAKNPGNKKKAGKNKTK
ncbi:MAG: sulfatase [Kiritimatiellae bacterium]|nr:sulfatase [Kiritimatiellia bacterium]MDD5522388.1 sulfatase [Kiritimatiellia bacterium]